MKEPNLLSEVLFGRPLSAREIEILEAAARGETMEETAKRLWLSFETIKSHRRHIIAKLGARNLPHALALAIRSGALSVDDVESAATAA